MTKEELDKRIRDISSRVYDVDCEEPDPQEIAIEEDIKQLIEDLGVKCEEEKESE